MNFQMCLQRHTSAACGTSVLQPLKADRKYPHYWSVADYSYIHSIICSPTCLLVHSFTLWKIAAWFEWRVSCVFTEEMRVFCVGKLLWFKFTYGSQPKCWNLEPRWLSSCTWPDRAVCVCVCVCDYTWWLCLFWQEQWGLSCHVLSVVCLPSWQPSHGPTLLMAAFMTWCHLCEQAIVWLLPTWHFPPKYTASLLHTHSEERMRR